MSKLVLLVVSLLCILPVSAQDTPTFKKCQDAEGKWHYGDHAALECEQSSRITEMDEVGNTIGQTEAPPTQEELDAKQRAEEQVSEQEIVEANQRRLDQKLLNTYDSAENIRRTRDALLAFIDSSIEGNGDLKQRLVDVLDEIEAGGQPLTPEQPELLRQQIADYDIAIQDSVTKRQLVLKKYDADYERYLELTTKKP